MGVGLRGEKVGEGEDGVCVSIDWMDSEVSDGVGRPGGSAGRVNFVDVEEAAGLASVGEGNTGVDDAATREGVGLCHAGGLGRQAPVRITTEANKRMAQNLASLIRRIFRFSRSINTRQSCVVYESVYFTAGNEKSIWDFPTKAAPRRILKS